MKLFATVIICFITYAGMAQADSIKAAEDTLAPYQKTSQMPAFSIQLRDSSWFSKVDLKVKKPTLILYFSPDCGHCQMETEELLSKINQMKDLQVVMVTSKPLENLTNFIDYYKIYRFPSIKAGSDPNRLITRFFDVRFTPFSALYDKKGRLVKIYRKGIDYEELIKLANN